MWKKEEIQPGVFVIGPVVRNRLEESRIKYIKTERIVPNDVFDWSYQVVSTTNLDSHLLRTAASELPGSGVGLNEIQPSVFAFSAGVYGILRLPIYGISDIGRGVFRDRLKFIGYLPGGSYFFLKLMKSIDVAIGFFSFNNPLMY